MTANRLLVLACLILTGCENGPREKMIIAVSDEDPDVRRVAVTEVANGKSVSAPWAIDGFVAIAALDRDTQARCVALRALGRSGSTRGVDTCLMILNHTAYPPTEVRPPDALCRWDAAAALTELAAGTAFGPEQQAAAEPVLIKCLESDTEPHVRLHAADVLGQIATIRSLDALIAGLRDRNFAVVSACENALVRLTGQTHDCDAYAWKQWREQHGNDPFANAGRIPESRRAPYDGPIDRALYRSRQNLRWIFPGPKK